MKISVMVPIYKESKYFTDIAGKILQNSYENKEIIAVVDGEMTPEISDSLNSFNGEITVIYPNKHTGKALALNNAVKKISTDIILFLDNDIMLPDDPEFLSYLHDEMKTHDIVEMPKSVIVESIYSAMISYEYLSIAMACVAFSAIANKSPGVIGAAFAVKKELFDSLGGFRQVVHEDGDFGARAFRVHAKYSYCKKLLVRTSMPNTLSDWIKQRKRWTLINVLWFKDNFLYLMLRTLRHPSLFSTLFLIILPACISISLFYVSRYFNIHHFIHVVFMITQPFNFISGILLWFTQYSMISNGLTSIMLGFGVSLFFYFIFSRFIKFRFNFFEYILYYFLYIPMLITINVIMFIMFIRKKKINIDWKV